MKSPFKFLDAYTLEDKDCFFGRDSEIDELYRMVFKTPLLLVYGLSGTGKTSLIQCGLASCFEGPDWFPLLIRKEENINQSLRKVLRQHFPGTMPAELPETIRQMYRHYFRPVYLIFDQLEELFIMGTWEEQQQFIEDIKSILDAELPCTILFVLREEYIGRLYNFEKTIPELFDFRLRVEPMNTQRVKEVLQSSFQQFNITLDPTGDVCPDKIVDSLSAGKSGIQLPYLQVYLDMLWREDFERTYPGEVSSAPPASTDDSTYPPIAFTLGEIEAFGQIEQVLEKFLDQQETAVQQALEKEYPDLPEQSVHKVLDIFVTDEGTKRPIPYQSDPSSKTITLGASPTAFLSQISPPALSQCLHLLQRNRLIRFTDNQIELAHDSLAKLIDQRRTDEQRQINALTARLRNNYQESKLTTEFLTRRQLNTYESYLDKMPLNEDIRQYVKKSQAFVAGKERQTKMRRRLAMIAVMAIAVISTLFAFSFRNKNVEITQQTQKNTELSYQLQLSAAESMVNIGQYRTAIKSLEKTGKELPNITEQQKEAIDRLITQYRKVNTLIIAADSLFAQAEASVASSQSDQWLVEAYLKYQEAYQVFKNDWVEEKVGTASNTIKDWHKEFTTRRNDIQRYAPGTKQVKDLDARLAFLKEHL